MLQRADLDVKKRTSPMIKHELEYNLTTGVSPQIVGMNLSALINLPRVQYSETESNSIPTRTFVANCILAWFAAAGISWQRVKQLLGEYCNDINWIEGSASHISEGTLAPLPSFLDVTLHLPQGRFGRVFFGHRGQDIEFTTQVVSTFALGLGASSERIALLHDLAQECRREAVWRMCVEEFPAIAAEAFLPVLKAPLKSGHIDMTGFESPAHTLALLLRRLLEAANEDGQSPIDLCNKLLDSFLSRLVEDKAIERVAFAVMTRAMISRIGLSPSTSLAVAIFLQNCARNRVPCCKLTVLEIKLFPSFIMSPDENFNIEGIIKDLESKQLLEQFRRVDPTADLTFAYVKSIVRAGPLARPAPRAPAHATSEPNGDPRVSLVTLHDFFTPRADNAGTVVGMAASIAIESRRSVVSMPALSKDPAVISATSVLQVDYQDCTTSSSNSGGGFSYLRIKPGGAGVVRMASALHGLRLLECCSLEELKHDEAKKIVAHYANNLVAWTQLINTSPVGTLVLADGAMLKRKSTFAWEVVLLASESVNEDEDWYSQNFYPWDVIENAKTLNFYMEDEVIDFFKVLRDIVFQIAGDEPGPRVDVLDRLSEIILSLWDGTKEKEADDQSLGDYLHQQLNDYGEVDWEKLADAMRNASSLRQECQVRRGLLK